MIFNADGFSSTQTAQPCSWAVLNEGGKDLNGNEPETEDNRELLLSIFDGLNNLYEKLSRLCYILERRNMEQILYRKG